MIKRRFKLIRNMRMYLGVAIAVAAPFISLSANNYVVAHRANPNAIGGEVLIMVVLSLIAFKLISSDSEVQKIDENAELDRFKHEHIDISIDNINSHLSTIYSNNGVFDIIDSDGNHHMIRISRKGK